MLAWVLILTIGQSFAEQPSAITTTSFYTKAGCMAAGEEAKKNLSGAKFICVERQ